MMEELIRRIDDLEAQVAKLKQDHDGLKKMLDQHFHNLQSSPMPHPLLLQQMAKDYSPSGGSIFDIFR